MAAEDRPRAAIAGIVVVALAGLAALFTGGPRLALIVVLSLVVAIGLIYLLATSTPAKVLVRDLIRSYDRGRFRTWLMPYTVKANHTEGTGLFVVLLHPDHRSLTMQHSGDPRAVHPMMLIPGLRCEVKRYLRPRKYPCGDLHPMAPGTMTAGFPRELVETVDGTRQMVRGLFVIRWKQDGRRRALARATTGFDGERFLGHPIVRAIHQVQTVIQHLRDMDTGLP